MSDFLHHLSFENQERLLRKAVKKLDHGGMLILKEIDQNDGWRMVASRIWDFLLYPKESIYYRKKTELIELLFTLGMKVKHERVVAWFPGSTYLYICQKK